MNTKIETIKRELNDMQIVIDIANDVKKIIKQFDNKKFSKRLQTALSNYDDKIHVYQEYNTLRIDYWFSYSNQVTIAWCCVSSSYGDGALTNDRYIIADVINNQIDNMVEHYKSNIAEITEQLNNIDNIIKEYNFIYEKMKQFNDKTNIKIRDKFNINFKLY